MKKRTLLLIICLLILPFFQSTDTISATNLMNDVEIRTNYTIKSLVTSQPIRVFSDNDFVSLGFPGNGTAEDPYRIENFLIENQNDYGIFVSSVTKYFVVQNCEIANASFNGILISRVGPYTGNVSNNIVTNSGLAGIRVQQCVGVNIQNNYCEDNIQGIELTYSPNCTIKENILFENEFSGITLEHDSEGSIVDNNVFENNRFYGLDYFRVSGSSVYNNTFVKDGLRIDVETTEEFLNYSVENNLVNGKKLGYFKNSQSFTSNIAEFGQLFAINSSNMVISNQVLQDIFKGLYFRDCFNITLTNNTIDSCWQHGISLLNTDTVNLIGNILINNSYGLNLGDCYNLTLIDNRFYGDGLNIQSVDFEDLFNYHVENNTVNDLKLGYYFNEHNLILDTPEFGQLILVNCSNFQIANQYFNNTHFSFIAALLTNSSISNITIEHNLIGMMLFDSEGLSFDSISANNCTSVGVRIYDSANITINQIQGNMNQDYGLEIRRSVNVTVSHGEFNENNFGILLVTCYNTTLSYMSTTRNNIINIYGYETDFLYIDHSNMTYSQTGLQAVLSAYWTVNSSRMNQNQFDGVRLIQSLSINFYHNNVSNNFYGIKVQVTFNCTFAYNRFRLNDQYGISLDHNSDNHIVHHNYFLSNRIDDLSVLMSQAMDDGVNNTWYDVVTNEGNYWSNIDGYTYRIAGFAASVDLYPLNPSIFTTTPPTTTQSNSTSLLLSIFVFVVIGANYWRRKRN